MRVKVRNIIVYASVLFWPVMMVKGQQPQSDYRIQLAAFPRHNLDSLKSVCNKTAKDLQINAYLLDQDNYYKLAVGDFSSFTKANEKLQILKPAYRGAWIIPSLHEYVIHSAFFPIIQTIDEEQKTNEFFKQPVNGETNKITEPERPIVEILTEVEPEIIIDIMPLLDENDLILDIPQYKLRKKKFYPKVFVGGAYVDLHTSDPETRYCTYTGLMAGVGVHYLLTKHLFFNMSADYSLTDARALYEKHHLTGNASVLKINPSIGFGSNWYSRFGIYGKLGVSYFNYDYAYSLELKPGFSGGPASVDAELLERAYNYGLNAGIGIRLFRDLDVSFNSYYDLFSRQYHSLKLGFIF